MKKLLLVFASLTILLFASALIIPLFFQDQLAEIVTKEANKSLKSKVSFDKLRFSFFKNFPNASLSLKGLSIVGTEIFENDTLLQASDFTISMDAMSLFNSDLARVNLISVHGASFHFKVLKNGEVNWDIILADTVETDTVSGYSDFELMLQKIELKNCNLFYDDKESDIFFSAVDIDGEASGDFAASITNLLIDASIQKIDYSYDGMTFLKSLSAQAQGTLEADFNRFRFGFSEVKLNLNKLNTSLQGWLELPEEGFDMDLKLSTTQQGLPDFLSIIPGVYLKSLDDFKSSGEAQLTLDLKGRFNENTWPGINLLLKVEDANLSIPQYSPVIEGIQVDISIVSPESPDFDNAEIYIRNFGFVSGKNFFQLKSKLSHLISNPNIFLNLDASLKLDDVAALIPVKGFEELKGNLRSNIRFEGDLRSVEHEKYQNVKAEGSFELSNLIMPTDTLNVLEIETLDLILQPNWIQVRDFNAIYGKSDFKLSGQIHNLLSYFLAGEILKADFILNSETLNMSDFAKQELTEDSTRMELIRIPDHLDVNLSVNAKKILVSDLVMKEVKGIARIYENKLFLDKLNFGMFNGEMYATGYYQSPTDLQESSVNFDFNLMNISFVEAAKNLKSFVAFAPVLNQAVGDFSMKLNYSSILMPDFSPNLKSIVSEGFLKSENVSLSNSKTLTKLMSGFLSSKHKDFTIKDLNLPFRIQDGNLITQPFELKMGGSRLKMSGKTNLTQEIDYQGTAFIEDGKLSLFGENIKELDFRIKGRFAAPTIEIDAKKLSQTVLKAAAKTAAKELLHVETDEALQAKITRIRKEAQVAAEAIINKADLEAGKIEAGAKSTLAKIAARKAADQLRLEAKKQAEKIVNTAELKVQELLK